MRTAHRRCRRRRPAAHRLRHHRAAAAPPAAGPAAAPRPGHRHRRPRQGDQARRPRHQGRRRWSGAWPRPGQPRRDAGRRRRRQGLHAPGSPPCRSTRSVKDVGIRGEPSVDAIAALRARPGRRHTDLPDDRRRPDREVRARCWSSRAPTRSDTIEQMRRGPRADRRRPPASEPRPTSCSPTSTPASPRARRRSPAAGAAGAALRDGRRLDRGQHGLDPACSPRARCCPRSASELGLKNAWTGKGDADYGPRARPTSRA